jgi:RNA polymerase sigma factor (sigma-70 family)
MATQSETDTVRVDPLESAPESVASPPLGAAHKQRIALLFAEYHRKLEKYIWNKTGSREEAQDIASQAFTELLARNPGSVGFFERYLYRVARNLATDHLKHQSMRLRKQYLIHDETGGTSPSPESVLVDVERDINLGRAIEGLPPRVLMVFVLRILDGLPYDEIVARFAASGVQLTERTIRRYLERAFVACRREILAAESPDREKHP